MKKYQQLRASVHLPFSFAVGATASRFYRALRDEKTIYGTRCDNCQRVSVPARSFCSHCCKTIDHHQTGQWIALPEYGTLIGWCETPNKDGFFTALIQLEGADNLLLHRVGQCDAVLLHKGLHLRAAWKASAAGTITDIVCFKPERRA